MRFKPMKQVNWMELSGLLVGIFFTVAVTLFGLVLYTKLFTSGMIGVEEYKIHSIFEKAMGLRPGTRVQISGVDVGQISEMKIQNDGVYMEFTIRKEFQNWITDSAEVFAIRDQNLISARVINIDVRRGKGNVLHEGDFIRAGKAQDIETVLETTNELLGRVNELIDAADTLVGMAMDTGTTIGALFGSRILYDNLNRQLNRLDDITYAGKNALVKTSKLLDTLSENIPPMVNKIDNMTTDLSGIVNDMKPFPGKVDELMGSVGGLVKSVDTTMGRVDGIVEKMGLMTSNISDFMETTEGTLQNADDLMEGISNIWIVRRNMPSKDSVPFMVETLW
ncbi:MlaD family protein [Fibrobacter sp. UBA4309]|uniref:MlaD family protein n=1 Tax=Fibrobacter sp. UBA4309 TaxID=1946537 RepID=UPI0025BED2AE|nr:MlaD family protein [Fibrobacter sp. UBA4309]